MQKIKDNLVNLIQNTETIIYSLPEEQQSQVIDDSQIPSDKKLLFLQHCYHNLYQLLTEYNNISFDSAIKANNKYEEIHYVLLDIRGPKNSFLVEQLFDDKLIHNKYDICGILAKTEFDATGNKAQLNKLDKEAIKEIINQLNKC